MKSLKVIQAALLIALFSGATARAGIEDFHSLINESLEAKKELTQKLKKNVETVAGQKDLSSRQKIVVRDAETQQVENVVVPSQGIVKMDESIAQNHQDKRMEKERMRRLSEEIKDAQ